MESIQNMPVARSSRGIALVAILAVLTVIAIIACTFALYINTERMSASLLRDRLQADMLAQSGLEHAMSLLEDDIAASPALDAPEEDWYRHFHAEHSEEGIAIDGISSPPDNGGKAKSRWIYLYDEQGRLLGRYAVQIEDEAGKINVNTASALTPKRQHQGLDTFEIMLSDGKNSGLPLSVENSSKIINYRYGRDNSPGQANADDNNTLLMFGNDLLDNNANMMVDEENEGIDEQQEYVPRRPAWDDRSFLSVGEMARTCLAGNCTPLSHRVLSRFATVHSRDSNRYWSPSGNKFMKKINVNAASKHQINKVIRMANDAMQFQASDRHLRQLVCNVIDYRDENQVLTTQGSAYGVEAICFNEIMANNGSYVLPPQANQADGVNRLMLCHRFGWWYNMRLYLRNNTSDPNYGFQITYLGPRKGGAKVVMNGVHGRVPATATIKLADDPKRRPNFDNSWYNFKKIRKIYGNWVPDLWKNSWLVLSTGLTSEPVRYPIVGNTRDTITVGIDDASQNTYARLASVAGSNVLENAAWIDTLWRHGGAVWAVFPEVSDHWVCPVHTVEGIVPPKNLYYKVYFAENVYGGNISQHAYDWPLNGKSGLRPWKGYATYLDVDGDPSVQNDTEMEKIYQKELQGTTLTIPDDKQEMYTLRYPYLNGRPVQARDNWISVLITSGKKTGFVGGLGAMNVETAFRNKNSFEMVQFIRPDIVELVNISDRPVSLHNWRVVINTGSYADQVGLIDHGLRFENRFGPYEDPGAVIPPHGYFYLTNSREIFDLEYGDKKDGQWGSSAGERYPCYELPDALWGVRYRAKKVVNNRVYVEGADWDDEQMQYETIEVQGHEPVPGRNEPLRQRRFIWHSGKDWLAVESWASLTYDGVRPGDDIMIQGMPRQGGFLSMTLKNAYSQICSRTIEYGSTEPTEIGYSTEKFDPTHYTWVKTEKPTFGGLEHQARNHDHPARRSSMQGIKDRYYASVAELQTVRTANDWETLGKNQQGKQDTTAVKAMNPYLTITGVRLEAEEGGAHIRGWQPAFGTIDACHGDIITAKDISWQPGLWQSSLLRMLNGSMQNDTFVIKNNSARGVQVTGYGSLSGKRIRAAKGDIFSVGPGYSSCMYYSIHEGDPGEWEWKHKGLQPANYDLYIYGLSDSIDTTEFLEENFNTELEVEVFNYVTREYDALPLGNTAKDEKTGKRWQQYDKSDGIYCGEITPDHVSPEGGIKLRITPHNLKQDFCSGFAWFDYAYLAPGQSSGKINVNTASPRVLRALNSVTPELADNIAAGKNQNGKHSLRPYQNTSDILDVRGMDIKTFGKICNLVTTRSDQFRVRVIAESLSDINNDGVFTPGDGDQVMASSRINAVIDRSTLTDDNSDTRGFTIQIEE